MFEVDPDEVPALEVLASAAYLAGLRDAGWQGNPALVRLGYTAWCALWFGAVAPMATAIWTDAATDEELVQQFGRGREGVAAGWATLCELALDRADEARQLMDRLHLG